MKYFAQVLILAGFIFVAAGVCFALDLRDQRRKRKALATLPVLDHAVMIEAIAVVESGNDPHAVGRAGERGRCQFMERTWQWHTTAPFLQWAPVDCPLTRKIERAHLSWVCRELDRLGHVPDPALVAAGWRFGPRHAAEHIRAGSAQRAAVIYAALLAAKEKAAP